MPVITADKKLAGPREVKRFMNRARYFAMRLRYSPSRASWMRRRLLPGREEGQSGRTRLAEPHIVALTALQHVHPEWFRDSEPELLFSRVANKDGAESYGEVIGKALDDHTRSFHGWPTAADIRPFFAVVGEYVSNATAAPPPTEPQPEHSASPR